jgi:transcriptional/translational regulatory protein YebC/TACO1
MEGLTDNKNRTVGEIRHLLDKYNGKMADRNTALRKFSKRGQLIVEKSKADEETLMNAVLEAGADDMQEDGDSWEVLTAPEAFDSVRDALTKLRIEPVSAAVAMVPFEYVKLTGKEAQSMLKLMDVLEDHDDVQHVWSNFDIDEKELEASLT